MKKHSIFLILSIIICLVPLLGMAVRPTTVTTENRAMAEFPKVTDQEGGLNLKFFEEFEKYFNQHFAFRNELVYADGRIQTDLFKTSSVDTVIAGSHGWLFYKSTLGDYLGTDRLSDREIFGIYNNISIVSRYLKDRGIDFVWAVPPNKNTLYPENMPYYDNLIVDKTHNIDVLGPMLTESQDVNYADLLDLFRGQDEALYLKRDSHWNNLGALMAYNRIMEELGHGHKTYDDLAPTKAMDEQGDLNKMVYTLYGTKEANYRYDLDGEFSYGEGFTSVEDPWIQTNTGRADPNSPDDSGGTNVNTNTSAQGTLLMFRDSFGNTLIPFVAGQFETAYFTKESPYGLEPLLEEYHPDYVIFEKVERNLTDFLTMPPIITAPAVSQSDLEGATEISQEQVNELPEHDFNINYYLISGTISNDYLIGGTVPNNNLISGTVPNEKDLAVFVQVNGKAYQAYITGDNSYELYLKKDEIASFPVNIKVLVKEMQ